MVKIALKEPFLSEFMGYNPENTMLTVLIGLPGK